MIHTHHHDSFSTLDGVGSPRHCARIVADLGQAGLVQSNHGNLNGALAHRKACQEVGIIPIVGLEAYWRPNRLVREKEWRYRRWHLILLAKNLTGWHNLIRISSAAFADGFYQSPCIDWDLMERYSEGVICTTSCVLGPLAFLVQNGTDAAISEWVERAKKIYGDDLFFSIMPHDFDRQRENNLAVVSLANQHGLPVLHEKDSHYPEKGWVETQKIAILTGMNKTFEEAEEANRKRIEAGEEVYELWHDDLHLSSEEEDRAMYAAYHPDLPQNIVDEAIANTDEILRRVEPYLPDQTLKMPRSKDDSDPKSEVLRWCRQGLKAMGKDGDPVYEERLQYEASVIDNVGAWPYFYLVAKVVRWARSTDPLPATAEDPNPQPKRPIRINSGRGSAAASLVCRASGITMVDPIAHKFKFERFLNPERRSMPDIDLDIASGPRYLIKEYVAREFGRKAVADIVAYQHFQPRAALKAVTKCIYGNRHEAFIEISKLVHEETGVIDPVNDSDLEKIREREPELDKWAEAWPDAWEHARRLENAGDPSVLRLSKHAGAVCIVPGQVTDFMPTIKADEEDEMFRTAWAETTRISVVDEIGIVKVDFLALKGMDQQQMILDMIEEHTGEHIDLDALPALSDPYAVDDDVMQIFRDGHTLGVNQLQGDGIREFLRRAQPQNIIDLAAVNALYRPGPLGSGGHNRYVKRKNGAESVELPEILQPVLGDTYGSCCFQESVMGLFETLVGYTAGQADDIRKIIAKLYRDKGGLADQKLREREAEFIAAATEKVGEELAQQLWQEILPFSSYSFNRAHAGSYMIQGFQDAWLKKRYALFFYAVLLTLEEKKTALILREASSFDVAVLPPDINISGNGFTPDFGSNAIRYGLRGIKGIGDAAADQILADRAERPFASLEDFIERSSRKYSKVNKGAREKLLRVGALDCFGARADWTPQERATAELELLGVALEPGGALGEDAEIVKANVFTEQELESMNKGDEVTVAGKVIEVNKFKIKRGRNTGQEGANFKLVLDLDHYKLTSWPETWERCRELIESGQMLMVLGKLDDSGKVIVRDMMPLSQFVAEQKSEQEAIAA